MVGEDVVTNGLVSVEFDMLRNIADADVRSDVNASVARLFEALEQAKDSGLAGAVDANEPGLLAGVQVKGYVS